MLEAREAGKIRVLVVDDSALMRRVICNLLEEDPDLRVVGTAVDGIEAIERVLELKPDVVTLDLEMPRLDGLQTLGYLMSEHPTPCVMLSAFTPSGAEATLKALEYGAADFIQKPSGSISLNLERVKEELIAKIKVAKGIDLKRLTFRDGEAKPKPLDIGKAAYDAELAANTTPSRVERLVLIGCSTGGPRALGELIPALSKNLKAAVLVVQHMSAGFTKSLAARLDRDSAISVKEAEEGEILRNGVVYLAPGDWHMEIEKKGFEAKVRLNQKPPQLGVRPSVDVLFASVAAAYGDKVLALVLTGMGRDGTRGLKVLKEKGAKTLVQDESSCVVFGMPRSAIQAGLADQVLPLSGLASAVAEAIV